MGVYEMNLCKSLKYECFVTKKNMNFNILC